MKKFLLPLFAICAFSASTAFAQTTPAQADARPQPSPQEMAQHQTQRLTQELGLSPDQATKVEQIMASRSQDMQAMRGQMQAGTDRRQLREQMQTNRAKYDDQLKQVLTADQFTKYTALQQERRHHGPRPDADGKGKAKDGKVKVKAKATAS